MGTGYFEHPDNYGDVPEGWHQSEDGKRLHAIADNLIKWPRQIPVSERLPEVGVLCLWWFQEDWWIANLVDCGTYIDLGEEWHPIKQGGVTHWLPLPPKPE